MVVLGPGCDVVSALDEAADYLEITLPGKQMHWTRGPWTTLQRPLVFGSAVHRCPMRDDHSLERELEQGTQRPRRTPVDVSHRPHTELAVAFRERISDH